MSESLWDAAMAQLAAAQCDFMNGDATGLQQLYSHRHDVTVMGGADTIRQALAAGLVDELTIIVAPVILGGGKRLFDGFTKSLELEHIGVRQSRFATFLDYRVR